MVELLSFLDLKISKQSKSFIAGTIIGFFLGSNVDTAVQLHVSFDPSNPYAFDTPRVADTTIDLPNITMDHSFGSNNPPSSADRLTLAEITQNPPVGSVECPPFTTPIYDRVLHEQENATEVKIPKIVHISYKSRCVPTDIFADGVQRWKDELPDYSIYFHDDDAVDRLLQQDWPEFPNLHRIMQCMKYEGAMKIDLWRMLVIYKYGGIYTDIDNVPASEFQNGAAIHPEDTFFASSDGTGRPCQFVFAMEPQHPIAFFTIQNILRNVLDLPDLSKPKLIRTTGPVPFGRAYLTFLRSTNPKANLEPGVYQGFMNKTIRHESKWNWFHPLSDEMVEHKNQTMSRKERALAMSGLHHWWSETRKTDQPRIETCPCREYLYRLDHPSETKNLDHTKL